MEKNTCTAGLFCSSLWERKQGPMGEKGLPLSSLLLGLFPSHLGLMACELGRMVLGLDLNQVFCFQTQQVSLNLEEFVIIFSSSKTYCFL
jgi:hypothetical protein